MRNLSAFSMLLSGLVLVIATIAMITTDDVWVRIGFGVAAVFVVVGTVREIRNSRRD
ncbi:hypothetical protein ACIO6U_23080 [Streptomyces sp. NPDC087422]|uniref:hypothetical protein n=1 Tax=Streptomyces sp. NPDC087422 TaxID=3365786 RepID=UPI0038077090